MGGGTSRGWALLAHALAGLVPVLAQQALLELDASTLAAGRLLFALPLLLALGRNLGVGIEEQRPLRGEEWLRLLAAAWLCLSAPALWIAHGIALSSASHASVMAPLAPLVALALAQRPGERAAARRWPALALGGAAVLLLLGASQGSARGDLWIALGSAAAGGYAFAAEPLVRRHGAARVQLWALALSLPPLLLLAAAVAPAQPLPGLVALCWLALLAALYAGIWAAAWRAGPQSPPRATGAGLEAGVGLALAALAFGDPLAGSAALAAGCAVAGVAWAALPRDGAGAPAAFALPRLPGLAALAGLPRLPHPRTAPAGPALPPAPTAAVLPARIDAPQRTARPTRLRPLSARAARLTSPVCEPTHADFSRLHEVVRAARERLPAERWLALVGGAETESALARNRLALDALALRPRVLRDVSQIDPSTAALHTRLRIPVVLAPLAGLEALAPDGALAWARAARSFGTAFVQSSLCLPQIEASAAHGGSPAVLQIAVLGDQDWLDAQVQRAQAAGCAAVCLSTECAAPGRRERERELAPWSERRAAAPAAAALSWKYVEHYKQRFTLPLLLKGIATAQDAQRAVQLGVDVIYVSNHGGRQLDHARAATAALPEVVDAVAGQAQVWVDGGFCRGTDVLKALALGADAVAIGRLAAYGLAAAGERGVLRVLELLEDELCTALAQLGATHPGELDRSWIERCDAPGPAHALSAFPLLDA